MIPTIKHKKKAPKKLIDNPALWKALNESKDFQAEGFIYAVTKDKYAQGEVIELTISRLKAQRKCFTKSKKTRKAYYTKFIFDHIVPADILKSIASEIKVGK
jgi:pantoate kinase